MWMWMLICQLGKFMVRNDSTRLRKQSSLAFSIHTHNRAAIFLTFDRFEVAGCYILYSKIKCTRFSLRLVFAWRNIGTAEPLAQHTNDRKKKHTHTQTQIEHQTTKIKLIWNLQIYDFNNPFDRTACFSHSDFVFSTLFELFLLVCVIRLPSNQNGPIKAHFRSNVRSKYDEMMVLIFTCCFCIAANHDEKRK